MSQPISFQDTEERAVAILFCAVSASGAADNPSPEVAPGLKASFDALLLSIFTQHAGSYIDSIGDTSFAFFRTASAAVAAALALRRALSDRPLVAESQTLLVRICAHYSPADGRRRPAPLPALDHPVRQVNRIIYEGIRFTTRLLRRVPERGIGLSGPAYDELPEHLRQAFAKASAESLSRILPEMYSSTPPDDQIGDLWLDRETLDRLRASDSAAPSVDPLPQPPTAAADRSDYNAGRRSGRVPISGIHTPSYRRGQLDRQWVDRPLTAPTQPAAPTPPPPAAPVPAAAAPLGSGNPLTRREKPFTLHRIRTHEPRPDLEELDNLPETLDDDSPIDYASEAIVVIDIVQATATSDLFGWYSVGRRMVRYLRKAVRQIGSSYGLACMKSTGDGLLLTYRDERAADVAAVNAVQASLELLERLSQLNRLAPEERRIALRFALHFGEVDVLPDDREGPNVSFTFRVEAINHASLNKALNPIDAALLPERDYILCSERVHDIVVRRKPDWGAGSNGFFNSCGFFKLKGFTALHEVFLIAAEPRFEA